MTTFKSNKSLKSENTDAWDAFLERRLAADLDAFLEGTDEETFVWSGDKPSTLGKRASDKRRFYRRLSAVVAASIALVAGVALFSSYTTSQKNAAKEAAQIASGAAENVGDNASLVAWGVENWNVFDERPLANASIARFANGEFLKSWNESEAAGVESEESENAESAEASWRDALSLDENSFAPWKYEPVLHLVMSRP